MKIYGVFNYSKKIGKHNINFVRVANLLGWWCQIEGKVYGDYLKVVEKKFTQKICEEVFHILERQAKDTINELCQKQGFLNSKD